MPSTLNPSGPVSSAPPRRRFAFLNNPRTLGRLAWGGLAIVLVFLACFSVWVANTTHDAAARVSRSTSERNAYEAARYAVQGEESQERKYRLSPTSDIRDEHAADGAALIKNLQLAQSTSADVQQIALVDDILATHLLYLAAADHLFDVTDQGLSVDQLVEIDNATVDPLFSSITDRVNAIADAYGEDAARDLATLNDIENMALVTTPLVFLLGFLLMGLFWVVLGNFQRHLDQTAARFRSLVQNASDVVTILGVDSTVGYASPATDHVWGITSENLTGRKVFDFVHPDDQPAARAHLAEALRQPGTNIATELRVQNGDGSWRDYKVVANNLIQQASVAGIVVTYSDITDRKLVEQQLKYLAFHDPLTTLPNRALFTDRLDRALAHADRESRSVGVLFLDVDNFKVVNDSLGHQQGDALLGEVAARLQSCVRLEDTVARLGGDEFTVLVEDLSTEQEATELADRITETLNQPISLEGREVFVTASIGVALSVPHHDSPDTLLRNADLAMYRAKGDGKARTAVFNRSMETRAIERMEVETEMRSALDRGEFEVYYQPIFSLDDGRITEFEALVRWRKPDGSLALPMTFIPIAEETGLIVPLGKWVLDQACIQTRAWQHSYPSAPELGISVNLSARQFQSPHLTGDVASILVRTGLDPRTLKLEITESVAMQDPDATAATLHALKALGIRLAIDDFGTGYSSLSYLKRFPVDTLKIDRSFVDGLGNDTQDMAIVESVIALARALNLTTTGEGIETSGQQEHLRTLGCDAGQGYLFARPAPAAEIERLLGGDVGLPRAA